MILDPNVTNKRIINTYTQLLSRCEKIHQNNYDYSKVVFKGMESKVLLICNSCSNEFYQHMSSHLRGNGCPNCHQSKKTRLSTTSKFIHKANKIHKDFYQYEEAVYVNSKTKVKITCPKHGLFLQIPNSHLLGNGCPTCALENTHKSLQYTTKDIVLKANHVHNYYYCYSESVYTGIVNKMEIICPLHGSFYQIVSDHLKGRGCPSCAVTGFKTTLPGTLYYLKITTDHGELYKIGITNLSVEQRFKVSDKKLITVLSETVYENGQDAYDEEQRILKKFKDFKYVGPDVLSSGNTELFTIDVSSIK